MVQVGQATAVVSDSNALPILLRSFVQELSGVFVPWSERRKGHGTNLLRKVCADADLAGRVLILVPDPGGSDGMTAEQLEAWYGRHGFVRLQSAPVVILIRQLQPPLVAH